MNSSLRIVSESSSYCVAIWRHLMLLTYSEDVPLEAILATREAFIALRDGCPQGFGCLTVTDNARASEEVARAASSLARESFPHVAWSVCAITNDGFIASAARSALTAILSLAGQRLRIHVCRSFAEAASWQAGRPGGVDPAVLMRVHPYSTRTVSGRPQDVL